MERKIGEIFEFAGVSLEVVEKGGCEGCYFLKSECAVFGHIRGACWNRTDSNPVIFKKVDDTRKLLIKAYEELVRCGIESEIVDGIQAYLKLK